MANTYNYLDTNGVAKVIEQLKLKGLVNTSDHLVGPTTFYIKDSDRLLATYTFDGSKDEESGLREKYVDLGLSEYLAAKVHTHETADINGLTATLTNLSTGVSNLNTYTREIAIDLANTSAQVTANTADIVELKKVSGKVVDVKVDGDSVVTDKIANIDLTGKVDKETGKGLSTNDYTDEEKQKVAEATAYKHNHSNIALLDSYTQTEANLADTVSKRHSHSNKDLLDTYDQTNENISDAVDKRHEHDNKSLLDTYTQTEADLAEAVNKRHEHDNISTLNSITDTDITNWNNKYTKPSTGIPASDLEESYYLASNPSGYTSNIGTITEIKMNGGSKGTSGVVDLGAVITEHQDISGKADKATTLSGYGITDANITDGVITLGSNTITPITSHQDISGKADLASPEFTGTPKAPTAAADTNTTQIATTAFVNTQVNNKIAASQALIYKGTVSSTSPLPTTDVKVGWTYVVAEAGIYASQPCEVGDMIIAQTTAPTWTVIQKNIDGAVIGPASAVDTHIATFDGSTGKIIKDSGYTIETSVPSGAIFTDHITTATTSGTGNAVTSITADANGALTITKDTTFLTSHQDISGKADKISTVSSVDYDTTNSKLTKTINGTTTDVIEIDKTSSGTSGSTKLITSGAVNAGLEGLSAETIHTTVLTTKGDLIWASAASTPARLGIGTKGQVLTVSDNNTLAWAAVTETAVTDVQVNGSSVVTSGIANIDLTGKADKATTLEGYGITDAKIESGTITLGSNTITPITSHQDISGKADKATAVTHTASTAVGSTIQPIYIDSNGVATTTTYELNKTVPADAVFTDTITTATTVGDGNAVTSITATSGALTITKDATFLTSHQDISGKADKATTLEGYGITDAKINNGVITLGGATITPITDVSDKADKVSPEFTGTPIAPTAAEGTSTTQIATTAFVMNAVQNAIQNAITGSY